MVKEKNNKKDLMRGFLNTIKIDMNFLWLISFVVHLPELSTKLSLIIKVQKAVDSPQFSWVETARHLEPNVIYVQLRWSLKPVACWEQRQAPWLETCPGRSNHEICLRFCQKKSFHDIIRRLSGSQIEDRRCCFVENLRSGFLNPESWFQRWNDSL